MRLFSGRRGGEIGQGEGAKTLAPAVSLNVYEVYIEVVVGQKCTHVSKMQTRENKRLSGSRKPNQQAAAGRRGPLLEVADVCAHFAKFR